MTTEDIALGYKQLLEVERGWRDMKQVIDLRPRNFLNSMARWRRCSSPMTVPSAMLNAANRLAMPCRS
ncbi:hypothetical protein [Streptomyces sp. 900105245]